MMSLSYESKESNLCESVSGKMNYKNDPNRLVGLTKGLALNDLLSPEGTSFEINFDDLSQEVEQLNYDPQDVYKYVNDATLDLVDEVSYGENCQPFTELSLKMTKLNEDGTIKKQIIREGQGAQIPSESRVTINYNAYLEYFDEPFDSSYIRKKPFTFCLGAGETLPGLDLGVQSMKINEKSRFLIHYTYAYGKFGCLDKVPGESTVLFEVELINSLETKSETYEDLSEEQQKDFTETYKYCLSFCSKGNDFFKKGNLKVAIREYNRAVSKLESLSLSDLSDQEKQQQLLLRIFSNLVVAHTKVQQPKRACANADKVITMCEGTSLKVPTKVYFNKARSLMELGDYASAETFLLQARKLEPQNCEINQELLKLDAKKKESYKREKVIAKKMFKNNETVPEGDF